MTPLARPVFVETPANPTLVLTDIAQVARHTRRAGIPLIVDNTFLTPVLQRPLDPGADVSLHSATNHIDWLSTALSGAVIERRGFVWETTTRRRPPPCAATR